MVHEPPSSDSPGWGLKMQITGALSDLVVRNPGVEAQKLPCHLWGDARAHQSLRTAARPWIEGQSQAVCAEMGAESGTYLGPRWLFLSLPFSWASSLPTSMPFNMLTRPESGITELKLRMCSLACDTSRLSPEGARASPKSSRSPLHGRLWFPDLRPVPPPH